MIYFTADQHFGDPRLNLYHRDLIFDKSDMLDTYMKIKWNQIIKRDDTIYHLGDIVYDESKLEIISELNGIKILIVGNYDKEIGLDKLRPYFNDVLGATMFDLNGITIHLVHKPEDCIPNVMNICGHVHGLWQVQRNMINVGVDAWHFTPVSEEIIKFKINGIKNYYDDNVFAGELDENLAQTPLKNKQRMLRFFKEK